VSRLIYCYADCQYADCRYADIALKRAPQRQALALLADTRLG
jgi:hypothetical protein